MRAKTKEFLYLLMWSCEVLARPTLRNVTDSFEAWAYRNGFRRQLAELAQRKFIEEHGNSSRLKATAPRLVRLTEAGRLHALGGCDPVSRWNRLWDGWWQVAIYDVPRTQNRIRDLFRACLKQQRFGYLQDSVWISPDPMQDEGSILSSTPAAVRSLILLRACPAAGESNEEIVAAAWDFPKINALYSKHMKWLRTRPKGSLTSEAAARALLKWGRHECQLWKAAITLDPLLPSALLPSGYLGRKAWQARVATLARAAEQLKSYRLSLHSRP